MLMQHIKHTLNCKSQGKETAKDCDCDYVESRGSPMSEKIEAWSYTLTEDGRWLGQVVITSDGMFSSVTDWGNMSFAWRAFGNDFKSFLLGLGEDYFASKMAIGASYSFGVSRKIDKACDKFASKILPALKEALRKELEVTI